MIGMQKKREKKPRYTSAGGFKPLLSAVLLWVKSGEDTRKCQGEEVEGAGGGGLENKGVVSQVLSHPKLQQGAAILTCMFALRSSPTA